MYKTQIKSQDVDDFLQELTELTKKYELAIAGCTCCGSPWIYEVDESNKDKQYAVNEKQECLQLVTKPDSEVV